MHNPKRSLFFCKFCAQNSSSIFTCMCVTKRDIIQCHLFLPPLSHATSPTTTNSHSLLCLVFTCFVWSPLCVACVGALPQSNFISRQWLSTTVDCIRLDLAMHASRPQSPVWLKSAATPQRSAPPRKKAATARNIAKPPREIIITLADLFQGRSMENFLKRAMTK